jgi:hypothetical protein
MIEHLEELQGAEVGVLTRAAAVINFENLAPSLVPSCCGLRCSLPRDEQMLSAAAKDVGEEGWLAAAATAAAAAAASAAPTASVAALAAGTASDSNPSSVCPASRSRLLLAGLLNASTITRSYLHFPTLADLQRCVCDTLYTAAADCGGIGDDAGDATFWRVSCILADLFTGGSFGSAGDVFYPTRNTYPFDRRCVTFGYRRRSSFLQAVCSALEPSVISILPVAIASRPYTTARHLLLLLQLSFQT